MLLALNGNLWGGGRTLRLWPLLLCAAAMAYLVVDAWLVKRKRPDTKWNFLAPGLLVVPAVWLCVDRMIQRILDGRFLWAGVFAAATLAGLVLADALLWRGLRRDRAER